ncbi:hypothetical protein RND81_03G031900 [Saponaria officinalis]|uniref:HSF-type DNA-binding domain-containing protein n=1 Tax=Saponaria officinalis TaxID=3572 RepID=A0AAW1LY31_SAPOF
MALILDNCCDGILLYLDTHKSVPAPFLTKTYHLVDEPSTDHIVSWGDDDTTFVVWRPPEFARDLLPNYFKHNNFSSFVRQLNTYGFRKIVPDRWEFANEYFKRGEKHLLCEIHRRKTGHHQTPTHLNFNNNYNNNLSTTTTSYIPSSYCFQNNRLSLSPPNSNDEDGEFESSSSPSQKSYNDTVAALSEDNDRLRRSNNLLMSELAHMRKLYNDIIYFVQNHVKPVAPSNSNTYVGFKTFDVNHNDDDDNNKQDNQRTSSNNCNFSNTKLFGVSLTSKKRLHPDQVVETNQKTRFVMEKQDLGLNLMPPTASC